MIWCVICYFTAELCNTSKKSAVKVMSVEEKERVWDSGGMNQCAISLMRGERKSEKNVKEVRRIGLAPSGKRRKWSSFSISQGNHCISSDGPLTPLSRDGLASRKLRRHDWYHPLSQPLKVLWLSTKLHHSASLERRNVSLPPSLFKINAHVSLGDPECSVRIVMLNS
jgi:hypothetical protein